MSATQPVFVHLRLHTEFSITDGLVRIPEAVDFARSDGMPALAIADINNLFGWIRFYRAARGAGIKPLAGCDVWVHPDEGQSVPYRVLLMARNPHGYHALCQLLSRAWEAPQTRGVAFLERTWIEEQAEGLILLSGAANGDVGQALQSGNHKEARERAERWKRFFGDAFYLEVQRSGFPGQEALVNATVQLAAELDVPLVATHPIQFMRPQDFKAHEARVCIASGQLLADPRRPRTFTREQYFKSQQEMAALFSDIPEALQNAVEIARRCNLDLVLGKPRLPDFDTPDDEPLDVFLERSASEGLDQRLMTLYPDESLREKERPAYEERLKFECQTIVQMGFSGYFLIVADFIGWARHNGVPVGPGRGSGAGSLVAYCLGITDLDPLRYDLLFERFLNPERVSMPDFDVDFCQDGRDRVIEYVRRKYGAESVAQIATFGTMAAKAVIRDVGRVLDLPYHFVDQLAKLVPFELDMTLEKARQQEPLLDKRARDEEEVAELLALAERLEGVTRNVGMHAGGVLIAPGRLTDFTPLYRQDGSDVMVSQFDKDDVEKVGLVKFDFLGLRTLTILDWAERHVRALVDDPRASGFHVNDIPLDDPATYALFGSGNTSAVFQQESRSARDMEKRLKPSGFEDIIALMALNRPGPLQSGMVDDFINRRHGREKCEYFHEFLEPILRPTYGVIVYQEQVMQIAQVLAGYTLGGADLLRRAMGKKDKEEMARQRPRFIEGAVERGVSVTLATQLFDLMAKFGEYGFNKSHSAAYALVSYQTAWLKAHYPAQFLAATLSADMDDTDKVAIFVEDARRNNLEILPPDVNASSWRYMPVGRRQIRYGLGSIKGVGEAAALEIERVRQEDGLFTGLPDLCLRVDKKVANRRVLEALIKAGALDALEDNRAMLLASVDRAMEMAEQASRNQHQGALFGGEAAQAREAPPELIRNVVPWSLRERLIQEKSVLGYYFSGHPFSAYAKEIRGLVPRDLSQLVPRPEPVIAAGIVIALRIQQTRRGRMAIVQVEDGTARVEVAIFSELFDQARAIIQEDQLLVVEGKASLDNFTQGVRLTADRVYSLSDARVRFARELRLHLEGDMNVSRLVNILASSPAGNCAVTVEYANMDARCEIEWPPMRLDETLYEQIRECLGEDQVNVVFGRERVENAVI